MLTLTGQTTATLKYLADRALHDAYISAERDLRTKSIRATQREALHVAHLCRAMAGLVADWRSELSGASPGTRLSMASVFTHQTPYVNWKNLTGSRSRCELADLLVAVIDRTGSSPSGYAVLIQAKMSDHGSAKLTNASELTQFELFSKRPVFDLEAKVSPKGVDLCHYSPDSALKYGLATDCWWPPYSRYGPWQYYANWLSADDLQLHAVGPVGKKEVIASEPFSDTLLSLLVGQTGWHFELPPALHDWGHFSAGPQRHAWSELTNYLLEETFKKQFSRNLSGAAGRSDRGHQDVLCFDTNLPGAGRKTLFTSGLDQSEVDELLTSGNWFFRDPSEPMDGEGGGFGGDGNVPNDNDPPNGGVSSIVIEIRSND